MPRLCCMPFRHLRSLRVDELNGEQRRSTTFTVGDLISDHVEGKALHARERFLLGNSIDMDAGQLEDAGDPSPVIFPIELDTETHPR